MEQQPPQLQQQQLQQQQLQPSQLQQQQLQQQQWAQVPQPAQQVTIIRKGNCPSCQAGIIREDFTCCGIALAFIFFPIGILCCWLMRERKCSNCGYVLR